jgi:branched-subunit amino acid ABC-type transport system permease component
MSQQAVVSGLSIGSVYALIAQGYYVTFITTGALNFLLCGMYEAGVALARTYSWKTICCGGVGHTT